MGLNVSTGSAALPQVVGLQEPAQPETTEVITVEPVEPPSGSGKILGMSGEALLTGIVAALIAAGLLAMVRRIRQATARVVRALVFKHRFRPDSGGA